MKAVDFSFNNLTFYDDIDTLVIKEKDIINLNDYKPFIKNDKHLHINVPSLNTLNIYFPPHLIELYICNGSFTQFTYNSDTLTKLIIKNTALEFVYLNVPNIEMIDLSHNKIHKYDFNITSRLEFLNMSFNNINKFHINSDIIDVLNLSNNCIDDIIDINSLITLKSLNLSYNNIYEYDLTNLINLIELNISNTYIDILNIPKNIRMLNIIDTNIRTIPLEIMKYPIKNILHNDIPDIISHYITCNKSIIYNEEIVKLLNYPIVIDNIHQYIVENEIISNNCKKKLFQYLVDNFKYTNDCGYYLFIFLLFNYAENKNVVNDIVNMIE